MPKDKKPAAAAAARPKRKPRMTRKLMHSWAEVLGLGDCGVRITRKEEDEIYAWATKRMTTHQCRVTLQFMVSIALSQEKGGEA